jgi:hypothetical protein
MPDSNEPSENFEVGAKENVEESLPVPEAPETPWERIKAAFRHARRTSQVAKSPGRREMGKDRTKSLVVLLGAAIGMVLVFLGVFSTPQKPHRVESRRVTPDLGRRTTPGQAAPGGQTGSVTPVMSANAASNQAETGGNGVTAADIGRTGKPVPPPAASEGASNGAHTLGSIHFSDQALDREYAMHGYVPAPPPANPPTPTVPAEAPAAQSAVMKNDLKKPSLVFVRAERAVQSDAVELQPALLQGSSVTDLLPTGTRLVARLESPVSSAVAAPAVAVIEYNYERDGEIVVPAGARALGKLEQANRSGYASLHFDALQMPDGSTEKIDASAMGLNYEPLKGHVTGRRRGTRFLVESLTGLGTMASYLVGNSSGGFNAPFSSSALLRERLAGNVAIAGQNELNGMTLNQSAVVTLPGGTRFYLVLEKGAAVDSRPVKETQAAARPRTSSAYVPNLEELRELLELRRELSEMYDQPGTAATNMPQQ